ncbi:MAG: leucine-rich repeat domain-containing protein [Ruminococcaceae bacterium]|nr:leucine-rich repeat domain-containing protein [Oscillospiraceae bacterium]
MNIIKCYNCENEISDTEIVCPYCDYPVSDTKKKNEEKESALAGETVKIATGKDFEREKAAIINSIKEDSQSPEEAQRFEKEREYDLQSETLRRSLEERRAQREEERRKKKNKKSVMVIVVALIIIGAFGVIYLVNNLVTSLVKTTKTSKNRKAKREKVISSDVSEDLGFRFHSVTLTVENQTLIMDGFDGNEENKPWSEHSEEVLNLTIGSEITTIGSYSFDDLTNLEHVTLSDSVAVIGEGAFYGCSYLEEVTLKSEKSDLRTVGNHAFTNCESLEKIVFSKKLVRIGDGAFSGCERLEEVEIPDSVTEIGEDAFFGCHNLVIVCSKDSFAYEYAMDNAIEVKVVDDEEETPSDPENTGDVQEPSNVPENTPDNSGNNGSDESPDNSSQEMTKDEKLAQLQSQLAKAESAEERDRILQEIDKVAME